MSQTNGGAPATFPLDSFKDAAVHLRRPFTPAAVKFKVQATWESGGLIVAYIDARLVVERLNLIVPHLWHDAYRVQAGGLMWCDLTVNGITRSDVGEGAGKGLVSDALKRAAVRFGIGVSLYAVPSMMLNNQHLKRQQRGNKEQVTISPDGMRVVLSTYTTWLEEHGKHAFGEPLDHGDIDGSQGDHEADVPPLPADAPPVERDLKRTETSDITAPDPWVDAIRDRAAKFRGELREAITGLGGEVPANVPSWGKVLTGLNPPQRRAFEAWLTTREEQTVQVPWTGATA